MLEVGRNNGESKINLNTLITYQPMLNLIAIIIGAVWIFYTYNKQQKFKRIDNLNRMWERFFSNEKFVKLFVWMDKMEKGEDKMDELGKYSEEDKFSFLALMDEVAHYASEGEIGETSAIYKFQWHFRYVFLNEKTQEAFWRNIGGKEEANDKSSWGVSIEFAKKCNK